MPEHPDPLDETEELGVVTLGHIDALPADEALDEEELEAEEAIEEAIAAARRAGGLELELGIGFRPCFWRRP